MMIQTPTNEHMILVRGTDWQGAHSPAQMQALMTDIYAWIDGLHRQGILRGVQPLMEEGKIVAGENGASISDGVFAESKEAIAGYLILNVQTMDEALSVARACPMLKYGARLEVRRIADMKVDFV